LGDDDGRREEIRGLLAGGLKTEAFPRAYSQDEIQAVVVRTRGASLETKLVIGGFTLTPVTDVEMEQACETCMYYRNPVESTTYRKVGRSWTREKPARPERVSHLSNRDSTPFESPDLENDSIGTAARVDRLASPAGE
jgi:hypothetical protein